MNRRSLIQSLGLLFFAPLATLSGSSKKPLDFDTQVRPYLKKIPDREADLIELYYVHKRSVSEMAQTLDVPEEAISYRLSRGLQRLRDLLAHSPCPIGRSI
jgi:DNA-directed RNA polymerase specialized sigma24 family protein